MTAANPFLSTQKASNPVPAILHPLVLLSISDHITRHSLRKQSGPVVGALLGQQNGRQVTLEHTFDFLVATNDQGDAQFSPVWFTDRLEQMRTVHKDRQLDLVGWYTVLNREGPTPHILQVHEQIMPLCGESTAAVFLAFHPEDLASPSVGGKLPLTIFETNYEPDENGAVAAARRRPTSETTDSSADKEMTDVGDETAMADSASAAAAPTSATTTAQLGGAPQMVIKFREIPYVVEAGDAEMISIDFVAGGVANASAVDSSSGTAAGSNSRDRAVAIESGNRGKRRLVAADAPAQSSSSSNGTDGTTAASGVLSREDEELIATLTTRGNAIRMLHARLQLLTRYLESLEVAEAAEKEGGGSEGVPGADTGVKVSLPILRSIQALVQRLPLVVPPPVGGDYEEERQREANDVELVSLLLDDVMQNIAAVRQVSGKFSVVDNARSNRGMRQYGRGGGVGGGGDGSQGLDMLL
ncbi:cop9 signalosome subunit 6 [Grosmannia clavigera kw1407]|uniref:COP9 signalosome complex subunit 6 n=1 Tax=Grosmannia clavigera (strain kw1407 / UAMH 11150) TaxID=655863 RepID=F0X8L6_GROCL|nr:cop9 signalosome subunit 6 [Grosmannia clavigera kw1407]EFX05729.1 cop9 signalosome subunit 6 [Grosmannia clavigera kw1407]